MSHDEFRSQIPAYAASRLEPEAARRLEEHLAGCESCREVAATAAEIAGAIREGGEALFEPHPREMALRDYAGGALVSGEKARIERHLVWCSTCRLEVDAWNSVSRAEHSPERAADAGEGRARAGRIRWWAPSLGAAVGLAAGASLVLLILGPTRPPAPARPPGTSPAAAPERWGGDSPLYLLPPMERGGESTPVPAWSLGKEDSHLSVGVQPFLPAGIPDGTIYRLELVRGDGGTAWSMEMTAGRMREHLATPAGIVHVTLPTAGLGPGSYELRIAPAAEPPAPPIYRARVEITAAR